MSFERVLINGTWYTVDTDTVQISALNGQANYVYATFDAWNELFEEPVKLQYVSINGSKPRAEHPYRIIKEDEE